MTSQRLIALSPDHIVDVVSRTPIDWTHKSLGNSPSSPGNLLTPTPAVGEFLACLKECRDLMSWHAYVAWCRVQWRDWLNNLEPLQRSGVEARLCCNFYVSMVDSLHVWSMVAREGWFDVCVLDSQDDAVSKTDITLVRGDTRLRVALRADTPWSNDWHRYKHEHRRGDSQAVELVLTMDRPRSPGNKRWFTRDDLNILRMAA
jgi:hypothetical protein